MELKIGLEVSIVTPTGAVRVLGAELTELATLNDMDCTPTKLLDGVTVTCPVLAFTLMLRLGLLAVAFEKVGGLTVGFRSKNGNWNVTGVLTVVVGGVIALKKGPGSFAFPPIVTRNVLESVPPWPAFAETGIVLLPAVPS